MQVILISGKQGSGKTTLSEGLQKHLPGRVFCLKFASIVYKMHDEVLSIARSYGIPVEKKEGTLLQVIGTDWGRKTKGENVWVDALKKEIARIEQHLDYEYVVIDDCRFRNEFDAFPDAVRIRLEATKEARQSRAEGWRDNDEHSSETDLDGYANCLKFDAVIYTEGRTKEESLVQALQTIEKAVA